MKSKNMSRRSFLKLFAGATAGTLLLPISKLTGKQNSLFIKTNSTREAKYYKAADKLAG